MKNSFVQDKNGYKNLIKHLLKLNIKDAIIEYKIKKKMDKFISRVAK
jgi:hypothetical protein